MTAILAVIYAGWTIVCSSVLIIYVAISSVIGSYMIIKCSLKKLLNWRKK